MEKNSLARSKVIVFALGGAVLLYVTAINFINSRLETGRLAEELTRTNARQSTLRYSFEKNRTYVYDYKVTAEVLGVTVFLSGQKSLELATFPNAKIPTKVLKGDRINLDYKVTAVSSMEGEAPDPSTAESVESTLVMKPDGTVVFDLCERLDFIPVFCETPGRLFMESVGTPSMIPSTVTREFTIDKLGPQKKVTAKWRIISQSEIVSDNGKVVQFSKTVSMEPIGSITDFSITLDMSGNFAFDRDQGVLTEIKMKGTARGHGAAAAERFPLEYECHLVSSNN